MSTENPSTEEPDDPVDIEIGKVIEWITVLCETVPALSLLLISAGAQPGEPDMCLPVSNDEYAGLLLSFVSSDHLSEEQNDYRQTLGGVEPKDSKRGFAYAGVTSGESAIMCIRHYLDDHFKSARLH